MLRSGRQQVMRARQFPPPSPKVAQVAAGCNPHLRCNASLSRCGTVADCHELFCMPAMNVHAEISEPVLCACQVSEPNATCRKILDIYSMRYVATPVHSSAACSALAYCTRSRLPCLCVMAVLVYCASRLSKACAAFCRAGFAILMSWSPGSGAITWIAWILRRRRSSSCSASSTVMRPIRRASLICAGLAAMFCSRCLKSRCCEKRSPIFKSLVPQLAVIF